MIVVKSIIFIYSLFLFFYCLDFFIFNKLKGNFWESRKDLFQIEIETYRVMIFDPVFLFLKLKSNFKIYIVFFKMWSQKRRMDNQLKVLFDFYDRILKEKDFPQISDDLNEKSLQAILYLFNNLKEIENQLGLESKSIIRLRESLVFFQKINPLLKEEMFQ